MPLSPAPVGGLVVILALAVHVFGALGDVNFVSAFSMVIYLTGCTLFFLGKGITRALAFPLFFLVFMCPVPDAYLDVVALPLKAMATSFSLSIIDLLGIPYIREGFRLHLPGSMFIVGTPCNGLRSLISLSAIGFLFVYFIRSSWWKKLVFLSLILPISILLNGLRIAALLLIAYGFGQNAAGPESFLHDGSGIVVFVIGLLVLFVVGTRINEEKPS
jgi:exosortase